MMPTHALLQQVKVWFSALPKIQLIPFYLLSLDLQYKVSCFES